MQDKYPQSSLVRQTGKTIIFLLKMTKSYGLKPLIKMFSYKFQQEVPRLTVTSELKGAFKVQNRIISDNCATPIVSIVSVAFIN